MWNLNKNNNMMMQNQFMNSNESKIDEIIKPFQEKIKVLEEEIRAKDSEIARLKFKLYQKEEINFNPMNQMNFPMNQMNPMNNLMGQMNLMNNQMNQMNLMNNQMNMANELMNNNMQMSKKEIENLRVEFFMKDRTIFIPSLSNDKMEDVIKKFYTKVNIENESYEFFIKKKINNNLTLEENGIGKENSILVEKVKPNNNSSTKKINDLNTKENYNSEILGEPINIGFYSSSGLKVMITIGKNNTIKDAIFKYFNKIEVDTSLIGKEIMLLFNGQLLKLEDGRRIGQLLINHSIITVIDQNGVIGA